MPGKSFSWLHLTDLHYGLKGQDCLWPNLRQPFLDDLGVLHERCGPWDAVLFTGDLVQSGESAQFQKMQAEVLGPLWVRLAELGSGDAVLLAVPGNHDLYRPNPREDNAAIDTLLESDGFQRIETKFWENPSGAYRRVIKDAFAAYQEWWDATPHRPDRLTAGTLPGDFAVTLERAGRSIGLIGLNTAFLQLGADDYQGRLVWDVRQLHALCPDGIDNWTRRHDCYLLLTHQGPDWLTPDARKHGATEIAPPGRFAVHLFGHMHEAAIEYIRRGGARDAVRFCQGCSVFGMERFGEPPKTLRAHGYTAGRLTFGADRMALRLWPRIATNKTGGWRFIPDYEHALLDDDQGTPSEPLSTWSRKVAASARLASRTARAAVGPGLAVTAAHSTLPARRPFFGRRDYLARIAQYLLPEDRSWGVVLDGPGGIGKTALALEAAHAAPAEHFPLKLWITAKDRELHPEGEQPLVDHRVIDFQALLAELGLTLARDDIPRASPEERPGLVRHALSGQRALLVLDNLETFNPEDQRRVFELLERMPWTCRAIVTSRLRIGASYAVHAIRLGRLERGAADDLLVELGLRWPPVARLSSDDRDRLYAETGGNPILLTWTAGQLDLDFGRCITVDKAIERLQEAHLRQQIDVKNDPLEFVFGGLVKSLTAGETAVLAALVHFSRPAPIDWLLPLTGLSHAAAETALDDLRNRALLEENGQAATWLLPPLAAHYLRRVRPAAVGESGERLVDRVYVLAQENGYQDYGRFSVLDDAWPQIDAALPVLIAGDNRRLQTLCDALRTFLDYSGRWKERFDLSAKAEARAKDAGDLKRAGRRAFEAGWSQYRLECPDAVLEWAERADRHWKSAGVGARELAAAVRLRGEGHRLSKNYDAAIGEFRKALDLLRDEPPSVDLGNSWNSLAKALQGSGQLPEAEDCFRNALAVARSLEDLHGVATYNGHLAELALDRGQWPEAERLARETLTLDKAIGRKELIGRDCRRLAKSLAHQDRGAEGRCYAEQAVKIFTQLCSPEVAKAETVLAECL